MRTNSDTVQYLLTDHLGSTSLVVSTNGTISAQNRYMPWGEVRYSIGTMPTDYTYTGQKNAPEIGLMFYNARWYDPAIAHFTQADTIIPGAGSPQAWDRYAYVFNNPLKYTDPSGHWVGADYYDIAGAMTIDEATSFFMMSGQGSYYQVDLVDFRKTFQENLNIPDDKGYMACGIASAVSSGVALEPLLVAAKGKYTEEKGIQPIDLFDVLKEVVLNGSVHERDVLDSQLALIGMYVDLLNGNKIIVDMLASNNLSESITLDNGTVAHFARILGIDWENKALYIENTLKGDKYWKMSFDDFLGNWFNPERLADTKPKGVQESELDVLNYWWISINPE
jgi:RHS repeat-associated protein